MKKAILLVSLFTSVLAFGQLTNTTGAATTVPLSEVRYENANGSVTTSTGEVLNGTITFSEFGDKYIYLYQPNIDARTFKEASEIQSMTIDGRGTYEPVSISNTDVKVIALVTEDTDGYKIYQLLQSGAGVLGHKFVGGNIEGHYDYFLLHKRNGKVYAKNNVKKIEKTIGEYIDYCDEISNKVINKEKGFKTNLMFPDFDVLKKAILAAEGVCGK